MEEKCKDGIIACPQLPKYIICNRRHRVDFNHCQLKPIYSKFRRSTKSTG